MNETARGAEMNQISTAAEMALQRKDREWLSRHINGLRSLGLHADAERIVREMRRRNI